MNPKSLTSENIVSTKKNERKLLPDNLPPQQNVVPPQTHRAFFSAFPPQNHLPPPIQQHFDASLNPNQYNYGHHQIHVPTDNSISSQQIDGSARPHLEFINPQGNMRTYQYVNSYANNEFQNQHCSDNAPPIPPRAPLDTPPKPPPRNTSLSQPLVPDKEENYQPAYLKYFRPNSPNTNSRLSHMPNRHRRGFNGNIRGNRGELNRRR